MFSDLDDAGLILSRLLEAGQFYMIERDMGAGIPNARSRHRCSTLGGASYWRDRPLLSTSLCSREMPVDINLPSGRGIRRS